MQDTTIFLSDLRQLHLELTDSQVAQYLKYYEILVDWNEKMNLTAITQYDEVMKKHFVDSLSLIKAYDKLETSRIKVIDVGTGAGFPGLALKIAFPDLQITLLDSLNKRIAFLNAVIEKLGLNGISAIHGRAEDLAKQTEYREQYDLCVSRAVANLTTLSEYCLPYVKISGHFISYKSEKLEEEIQNAKKAIKILGGNIKNQVEFYLPDSDIYRNLVVIEKVSGTPNKYPRKAGLPSKEPLS